MATNTYTLQAQARTLEAAKRTGTHWTQAELDAVRELDERGLTDEQIALALQRSLYAIQSIHHVLAERGETHRIVAKASSASRQFEQGFTDLAAWEASFNA